MAGENRRDSREAEKIRVTVRGTDLKGNSFEEQTETIDMSAVGISFYLNTPTGARALLSIDIANSRLLGHLGKVQAVVIRKETSSSGRNLVAAQFI